LDAVLQLGHVEVDQQPNLHASQFHVGQPLGFVNPLDLLPTLELKNQFVFSQNVDSISPIKPEIFVLYRLWALEFECDPIVIQFISQALLGGRFQQPWSQMSMNFARAANHTFGEFVEFHLRALRVLRGDYPTWAVDCVIRGERQP
jgi:hypothetical protein